MKMSEIVDQISFLLGLPANDNVENVQIEKAVLIAFKELKRYMKTPVAKTVPFSTRIDLVKCGIDTENVLDVHASYPRIGLTLNSIDAGNVFQVAASVNQYSLVGNTYNLNIDPIMREMALAQVRNTISTDFQWEFDLHNKVIYVTHRDPIPPQVTIKYVPNYTDVSEIVDETWVNYLIRLSEAYMKKSLGRTRSKYTIEGSNVSLDGDTLLAEANAELEAIREELERRKNLFMVVN